MTDPDPATWRLLSLAPVPPERVTAWFGVIPGLHIKHPEERTPDAVRAAIGDADIVVTDWSGALRVDAAEVALARRLSFVMSPSVGLDNIDLDALTASGVIVANTAGLNAPSVAEWCLGAAFAVARSVVWVDGRIRAGDWPQLEMAERGSTEVAGLRVGVVGFGAVGSRVAALFRAIGCDVAYWTRRRRSADEERGASWMRLPDLAARSDILVVNVSLTPETRGLVDAAILTELPRGAIVIDASRGGVVDHLALLGAVETGRLRGAAIDVFEHEPLDPASPLRRSDRILLSSHAAATTAQSLARIFALVTDNVRRAVSGEPVRSVVNGLGPIVSRRPGG
ncbi:MAG: D-3-phosphoglycerate dehydrogenase / 2-oxoglutarate reductase [Chloroflexota bacterium]|nr:D-3-phosphoglycerate dehydrogenase / 2-oxoglutarate reductase [Chloroflexota bacterium]